MKEIRNTYGELIHMIDEKGKDLMQVISPEEYVEKKSNVICLEVHGKKIKQIRLQNPNQEVRRPQHEHRK